VRAEMCPRDIRCDIVVPRVAMAPSVHVVIRDQSCFLLLEIFLSLKITF
jgi:hypothetical protein